MELIRATERDVEELLAFYQHVADTMEEKGLQQWHWGRYPNEKMIREDITQGDLYYMLEGDTIAAAVVLMTGQEKEYNRLQWSCGVKPGIFHRLAVLLNSSRFRTILHLHLNSWLSKLKLHKEELKASTSQLDIQFLNSTTLITNNVKKFTKKEIGYWMVPMSMPKS